MRRAARYSSQVRGPCCWITLSPFGAHEGFLEVGCMQRGAGNRGGLPSPPAEQLALRLDFYEQDQCLLVNRRNRNARQFIRCAELSQVALQVFAQRRNKLVRSTRWPASAEIIEPMEQDNGLCQCPLSQRLLQDLAAQPPQPRVGMDEETPIQRSSGAASAAVSPAASSTT